MEEPPTRVPANVQAARHALDLANRQRDLVAAELNLAAATWRLTGEGSIRPVQHAQAGLTAAEEVVEARRAVLAQALATWAPVFTSERAQRLRSIEGALAEHAMGVSDAYGSLWELQQEFRKQGLEAPTPVWAADALVAKQSAGRLLSVIDALHRQRASRR